MNFLDPRMPDRFWDKVQPEPNSGCWLWTGATNPKGYGVMWNSERRNHGLAHRLSYEALIGSIPSGLCLDHLCRTPACVNPTHLEPVTNRENILRGKGCAVTHCPRGHAYEGENLRVYARGKNGTRRTCVTCVRERLRKKYRTRLASGLCLNGLTHGPVIRQGVCESCLAKRAARDKARLPVALEELAEAPVMDLSLKHELTQMPLGEGA